MVDKILQILANATPQRTANSPMYKNVCWNCRRSGIQLLAVRVEGKKTGDYVCVFCVEAGKTQPPQQGMSQQKIMYRQDYLEQIKEQEEKENVKTR